MAAKLMRLLRRVRPDIVLTWGYHVDSLGFLAATPLRVPVVWTIFSSFNPHFGRFVTTINQVAVRLSRFPAAVVTDSEAGRSWHTRLGYTPKQWRVIPIGFDIEHFRPDESARGALLRELALPHDAVLVGLVARFNPVKGHRTFVQAASALARQVPNAHFLMAGPEVTAENTALRTWVEESGLAARVHLLGARSDIARFTAALDIATLASDAESFPNVVGEAMACAVPCVVTDVGDAALMIADTGRVVPPRDAEAMAAAWRELIDIGREGRQLLGRRARARVVECYSLPIVVSRYEALLEAVVTDRSAAVVASS